LNVLPEWRPGQGRAAVTAARILVLVTVTITVAGGVLVWLADHDEFPNLGTSLWWSLQTVTTVGYGDVVPTHLVGKIIGGLLMIQGVALITITAATVTAWLMDRIRLGAIESEERDSLVKLELIDARLQAIERAVARLNDRSLVK
jgi:voltage-gated potassium channel